MTSLPAPADLSQPLHCVASTPGVGARVPVPCAVFFLLQDKARIFFLDRDIALGPQSGIPSYDSFLKIFFNLNTTQLMSNHIGSNSILFEFDTILFDMYTFIYFS